MMRWEFTYVDLWLGRGTEATSVATVQYEIARLGGEGWEPVGEVEFRFHASNLGGPTETRVPVLMFKRPTTGPPARGDAL